MHGFHIYFLFIACFLIANIESKQNKANAVDEISDFKEFKKILRTKNNILVCFVNSQKDAADTIKVFREAAEAVRGQGTMIIIDCTGEGKKTCKKFKVGSEPYIIRHYKDGEFHKVYDRRETVSSIVTFMRDPTGDVPWEEDSSLGDVIHIADFPSLIRLLKKESRPLMIMFYAPWCGFCKQLKPEYSAAATALKGKAVLAAIDVNRPENAIVRTKFNITGFPTLLYFENGELKYIYEGDNKKDDLIRFVNDPSAPAPKPKEQEWSLIENDVIHLTTETFDDFTKEKESILVMFYAPWCGHCKKMKPEYEKAATVLKNENINGVLAAVDATKEKVLAKKYGVKGYPAIKYFKNGEFLWDVPLLREADKLVSFMKDPKEPPPPPPPQPDWEEEKTEIIFLNVENFKGTLRKKKHSLVMFYAPWCGHCKMAKPEFTAAAEELKDNLKFAFAAVDCTKYSSICKTVNIEGYPTFKYFNYFDKGRKDYLGGRKKVDFVNFMNSLETSSPAQPTGKPSFNQEEVKTLNFWENISGANKIFEVKDSNYKNLISNEKSLIVMFYIDNPESLKLRNEFALAALEASSKLLTFASCDVSVNKNILAEYKVSNFPELKLFKNGKFVQNYFGSNTKQEIINFLKKQLLLKEEL